MWQQISDAWHCNRWEISSIRAERRELSKAAVTVVSSCSKCESHFSPGTYRNLLASLSDSSRHRISSTLTIATVSVFGLDRRLFCQPTGTLHVSNDASACVVHELDSDLGNTTSRACIATQSVLCFLSSPVYRAHTCSAEDSGDLHELDGDLSGIHSGG